MKTLIVERSITFIEMLTRMLEDQKIDYQVASSSDQVIEILSTEKIDLIFVPLYLNDISAIELTAKIRKIEGCKYIPILLLTSGTKKMDSIEVLKNGITDVFEKERINEVSNFVSRISKNNENISANVLLLEDTKSHSDYLVSVLQQYDIKTTVADNVEDAFQFFLSNHYSLVITDIVLDYGQTGTALINKIRRLDGIKGDVPILAITAYDDSARRISLYHLGISDYIQKPVIEEELTSRVRNLINNHKSLEREIDFKSYLNSEETIRRTLKLEAVGKLTGGIAHDFNNLLGVVIGYTELLKNEIDVSSKSYEYLKIIEDSSIRGAKLIKQLLSFTRKKSFNQEIVNLNTVIKESKEIITNVATDDVFVKFDLTKDLWDVYLDSNDFEHAIINMCINAKYAMNNIGDLVISSENVYLTSNSAEAIGLSSGDYVRISVEDNGCGMDSVTRSRVFDPFFTTKGDKGTGLGLSQVYGFAQRSNGTVVVESYLAKGSRFDMYFPRVKVSSHKKVRTIESGLVDK